MRSAAHTSDASAAPNRRPRNTVTEVRLGSFALSFSTQDATPAGLLPQAISLSARVCVRSEARDATVDRRRRAARQISILFAALLDACANSSSSERGPASSFDACVVWMCSHRKPFY